MRACVESVSAPYAARSTSNTRRPARPSSTRAWVAIWGAIAMLTSAPFDDWWHNAYGLDVKIVSPPHMVLAAGIVAVEILGQFAFDAIGQRHANCFHCLRRPIEQTQLDAARVIGKQRGEFQLPARDTGSGRGSDRLRTEGCRR